MSTNETKTTAAVEAAYAALVAVIAVARGIEFEATLVVGRVRYEVSLWDDADFGHYVAQRAAAIALVAAARADVEAAQAAYEEAKLACPAELF
jgi:multidrug efflux pump subunit AcrA (membrane-fusion protein)